jgi:hypothetical protein
MPSRHERLNDPRDLIETQAARPIFVVGIEDLLREIHDGNDA